MKLTAQEEYGIRCIVQLAQEPAGHTITVSEIARREALSSAYVEKLLRILNHAGLTESVRGINGGYRLTRPAETVSVGEVVRALSGGGLTSEVICHTFTGNRSECVHMDDCGIRSVWKSITDFVHGMLDHTPITLLLNKEQEVAAVIWKSSQPSEPGKSAAA